MNFTLPESLCVVEACRPNLQNGLDTGDAICCKNLSKVWVVLQNYSGGGDTDLVIYLYEATDVAIGTTAVITATFPIWTNLDTATSDQFTKQDDAANYTVDTEAADNSIVILEWDPAKFTAGYDCLYVLSTGGNVANYGSALYIGLPMYQSDNPPSIIVD